MSPCYQQIKPRERSQNSKDTSHKKINLEMRNRMEGQGGNNLAQQHRTNRWQRGDALG